MERKTLRGIYCCSVAWLPGGVMWAPRQACHIAHIRYEDRSSAEGQTDNDTGGLETTTVGVVSVYLLDHPRASRRFLAADGEVHVLLGCVDLLFVNIYVHYTCMYMYVCIYMWRVSVAGFGLSLPLSAHTSTYIMCTHTVFWLRCGLTIITGFCKGLRAVWELSVFSY